MDLRRILVAAFAFTTLLYGILAYAAQRDFSLQPISGALRRPVALVIYLVAIAIYVAAIHVPRLVDRRRDPASTGSMAPLIVRLVLLEGVAIAGLLAAWIVHDWRLYLPAWALTLLGFLRTWRGR